MRAKLRDNAHLALKMHRGHEQLSLQRNSRLARYRAALLQFRVSVQVKSANRW